MVHAFNLSSWEAEVVRFLLENRLVYRVGSRIARATQWNAVSKKKKVYPFCGVLLCPNDNILCFTKDFQFHVVSHIVDLSAIANGVLFRTLSPVPMSLRLSPTFSSTRFSVPHFMLRFWSTWSWVLWRGISMKPFGFFYIQPSSLTSIICWRCFLLSCVYV